MQTEIASDTDQSKQSLSPKFNYQNGELSELSYCEDSTSPSGQRVPRSYRKMRPASAPRAYVTETNIWREFNLPSYCMPDYRRTPAMYIEQDIINKQRQEIQLLMEELGNRDQELTDLVISHQKQVKAWECDNEKFRSIQAKLAQYEDELKSREDHLKKVLAELANVNDQREVDVKELKRTQSEMIKLTERILENSLYIKDMEAQNQKLNNSLREFANMRQAFRVREQELLSLLKEKDFRIADKQLEIDKLAEYIKILECQCRELGEQNTNINEDAVGWRKKYCLLKEEIERLNDDCKKKEENLHKMTQQLHESLQQAIALQKALFTSCEREKCKEEVMYSLRRQHKRTMQELQNIRELYDRLTRDTTLYHLSIKEKEIASEGKKKEEDVYEDERKKKKHMEDVYEDERKKKKHMEETPSWHDSRRKASINMSFHKLRQLEGNEDSFLLKERMSREGKHCAMSEEDSIGNNTEEECKSCNLSANYSRAADRSKVRGTKDTSQGISANVTPSRMKCSPDSNKACFTNQTLCAEDGCIIFPSVGLRNQPRNSESRITRSPCHSPMSDSSGISQKANAVSLQESRGNRSPETSGVKQLKEKCGVDDEGLSVSHTSSSTWHDGMCRDVNTDNPETDTSLRDPATQPQGSTYDLKPSRSPAVRNDDLPNRDQEEHQFNSSDEPALPLKQLNKKKCVEFNMQDKTIPPSIRQMGAQSHGVCSESGCYLPQSLDRKDASAAKNLSVCLSKGQLSRQQAEGVSGSYSEDRRKNSPTKCEDSLEESSQSIGQCQQCEHELNQENDCRSRESENSARNEIETDFKMKSLERDEHNLRLEICDQCRARGRRFCDCSRSSRSCITYSKPPNVTFATNVSSSDKSFPCQKGPVPLTSKFLFVENDSLLDYCSSLRETENSHAQDFSNRDFSEGPLTYPLMTEFKNQLAHQPLQKLNFSLPTVDSFSNQNQHHKVACEGLPDEVSAYLARQRCFKRETYYNNNNKSDRRHSASDTAADSSHVDKVSSNGQSLSRSNQSLPSSGQLAHQSEIRSLSEEKPQRTVVSNQQEHIFVQECELQKDRQHKSDHLRYERRGKVFEIGRTDVGPKRCDDSTNRSEVCGRGSCNEVDRYVGKTFDGDCRRSDVGNVDNTESRSDDSKSKSDTQRTFDGTKGISDESLRRSNKNLRRSDESQRRSNKSLRRSDDTQGRSDESQGTSDDTQRRSDYSQRSDEPTLKRNCGTQNGSDDSQTRSDDSQRSPDDCHRRSDVGQRGSDANKLRFDWEVYCDNSANNSNRENAISCSQGVFCDVSLADAQEKSPSESKQGLSVLKLNKSQEPRDKKLETNREFQYEQTLEGEVRESGGDSYFCPEETENEVHADCHPLLLTDRRKGPISPVRTSGHVLVRPAHLKSDRGLLFQKLASQHSLQVPQVVPTVSSTTDGEGSGEQNDKSGIVLSSKQVESNRFCEGEDRSGIAISSGHGRSDSRYCWVEGRSGTTISSGHRRSVSLSQEVEGRSDIDISSGHGRSDSRSQKVEDRSYNMTSLGHRALNSTSCKLEDKSKNTTFSEHGGSEISSPTLEGRSDITTSSEHGGLDSRSRALEGRSNNTSSIHRALNRKSCKLADRSAALSLKQDGFTLYSAQERLDNQLFPSESRSDETSTSQEGASSSSFEPRNSSVFNMLSMYKQSKNGFCELDHETRQEDYDSKHNIPTITSRVITTHCDSLDKYTHHRMSSDNSNGKVSVPSVRQRLHNCARGVASNSLRTDAVPQSLPKPVLP